MNVKSDRMMRRRMTPEFMIVMVHRPRPSGSAKTTVGAGARSARVPSTAPVRHRAAQRRLPIVERVPSGRQTAIISFAHELSTGVSMKSRTTSSPSQNRPPPGSVGGLAGGEVDHRGVFAIAGAAGRGKSDRRQSSLRGRSCRPPNRCSLNTSSRHRRRRHSRPLVSTRAVVFHGIGVVVAGSGARNRSLSTGGHLDAGGSNCRPT